MAGRKQRPGRGLGAHWAPVLPFALVLVSHCAPETMSPGSVAQPQAGSPTNPPGNPPATAGTAAAPPVLPAAPLAGSPAPVPSAGSGSTGDVPTPPVAAATLPCEVGKVVATKCGNCHGKEPIGGAPMSLVSQTDFVAQLKSMHTAPGETHQVAKLVKTRINDTARPMPPGAPLAATELTTLNNWLDQGMPAGVAADSACAEPTKPPAVNEPVTRPDGTKCYQFRNHGVPEPGDTSPYSVIPGEHYVSFYYKAPWTEPAELVNWRTIYDNQKVMHHWLLYSTLGSEMDGAFVPSIGTHIGDAAQLIAGWAVGGNDVAMPKDVGLVLPAPGGGLLLEWHFYNTDIAPQMDSSAIEICTLPAGTMKNTAGMTWLGTENFNGPTGMPPKVESKFAGTCLPSRTGMNATDPIHIFSFWPHMHSYGRHMNSVVHRVDGTNEQVFDKPFDFNYQITYEAGVDLYPGDTITSTCTFMNTSDFGVAFGPSSDQEMCYQFAFSYPVGALDNGIPSLVGATNTCW
ncbi:MAG: hypothetical protein ABW321_33030 [Polyangiales bacterium]